jgi:DNA polymerase-1
MPETIYLIDGHATLYRAYFAIKSRMAAPSTGKATQAAFGFTKVIRMLLEKNRPEYMAVTMDSKGPTFRHEIYPEYKATRPAMPDDLQPQILMVESICDAYGIPVFRAERYEADDVLGTLARQAVEEGLDVVIVSGDKDVLQLVDGKLGRRGDRGRRSPGRPSVVALDPQKARTLDAEGVLKEKGVPPEKMIDVFGLAGDTTDNIKGVKGVGPKTAVDLVREYGSLEAVLDAARQGKIKGKRGESIKDEAEAAIKSRDLATIRTDAPVELDLEAARVGEGDAAKLISVFQDLGFRAFLSTVAPTASREGGLGYHIVRTEKELASLAKELARQERFAVDLETDSASPRAAKIVGLSFSWKEKEAAYVPVRSPGKDPRLDERLVLAKLGPVLEDPRKGKVGQNAKFDMLVLRGAGVALRGLEFDTMVASYLLAPGTGGHGIDALALQHLGFRKVTTAEIIGSGKKQTTMDKVPVSKVGPYACEDADVAWRLFRILEQELRKRKLDGLYRKLELPLVEVLAEMEWNGIAVDREALSGLSRSIGQVLEIDEKAIYEAAGREFNIGSPKQLNEILYKELKLPVLKKTPTGAPSTDSDVLARLAPRHPLPELILRYRELAKLKSTYADSLPGFVNPETGRIHASFNQTVTATGRLSSSDPNLQNIPVRGEQGRAIRQCFVPGEAGWRFLSADYSQIELRLLAQLSGDRRLVEAFRRGADIHAAVAAELEDVPIGEVTPEQRRRAKTVNFGLMYGQGAQHLARSTGMTVEEAGEFISRYFRRFEGVKRLRERVIGRAREEGRVETILGRVRYVPEINSDDVAARRGAERQAFNTAVQGSAADLIKKAMIDIHRDLGERGLRSRMLLQIHDELLFEAPPDEMEKLRELVVGRMQGAMELKVPLVVDTGVGDNWLDVK